VDLLYNVPNTDVTAAVVDNVKYSTNAGQVYCNVYSKSTIEVCMGMGKTGIPWVPWDSHGNGSKISHGMGMGWEWKLSAWEWELRRGNWKTTLHTVTSKHLQQCLC